ncbi:VanZ family protein [Niabella beijingensis]|uniref:VanZ family protein n=1 Tax=Niabella beijingensis TaxID=2872700 RepID=UPI001CBEDAA0|nr:VanZ family protein [Niabella beijingensis]MBZ4189780.1 VanZ family protein [Niabella beijingensis]
MKRGYIFAGAILYFLITLVLLTLPGAAFPKESFFDKIPYFDKWVHTGMFTLLVLIWNIWLMRSTTVVPVNGRLVATAVAALAYGIVMEYVQKWYIPNRSFDVFDILADGAGAALGLAASFYLLKKNRPL